MLEGNADETYSVAFSPNGEFLFSGGDDRAIRVWRAEGGAPVGVYRGHTDSVRGIAPTRDGEMLASGGGDGTIRLWDLRSRRTLTSSLRSHFDSVLTLGFSPDGAVLASGAEDGTMKLWRPDAGTRTSCVDE